MSWWEKYLGNNIAKNNLYEEAAVTLYINLLFRRIFMHAVLNNLSFEIFILSGLTINANIDEININECGLKMNPMVCLKSGIDNDIVIFLKETNEFFALY